MTREELRDYVEEQRNINNIPYHVYSALIDGIDTLEQEPCETIQGSTYGGVSWGGTYKEQEPKAEQFAKWVAEEIFDEENWEYNKDAFAEIACRKLAKLGIVRAKGDVWELVEPQESEEQKNCDTCTYSDEVDGSNCYECVKGMRNNYKAKVRDKGCR